MATDTALPSQNIGATVSSAVGFAASVVLGCGWSIAASAATNLVVNCQEFGDSLQSLDAPASELSISLVDLPDNDADLGLAEPLDTAGANSDSTVPYLYLTPRVAAMLREVFDDDARNDDATLWQELAQENGGGKQGIPVPPVAEGNSDRSTLPTLDETDLSDPSEAMPRFQRQMYRTDI